MSYRRLSCSVFFALLFCVILSSCSSESDWEKALVVAAPENPSDLSRMSDPDDQNQTDEIVVQGNPAAVEKSTSDSKVESVKAVMAQVTISVQTIGSCRFGAVRCYLDRRYQGALDESGSLQLAVPAGVYEGELVDSEGHWLFSVDARAGQESRITLHCQEKVYFGEARLTDEEIEENPTPKEKEKGR